MKAELIEFFSSTNVNCYNVGQNLHMFRFGIDWVHYTSFNDIYEVKIYKRSMTSKKRRK